MAMTGEKIKPGIALCMICKDEERTLFRCLTEISEIVDEMVIVDTGSTDRTLERARRFTSNVFHFGWCNDFSAARNFAISKSTREWLLVLDADEVLFRDAADRLRAVVEAQRSADVEPITGVIVDLHEFEVDYSGIAYDDYIQWPETQCSVRGKLILVRSYPGIRYVGRIHESLDFANRNNKDLASGIPCAHFRDLRRRKTKDDYYFELELEALTREPMNSNAHINVLRTYLLRGLESDFVSAAEKIYFVEPRFRRAFVELQSAVVKKGWRVAIEQLTAILTRT